MNSTAAESLTATIFYTTFGIAAFVTSVVIALRFVKNCSSPLCSCTQDTAMSGAQPITHLPQPESSLISGVLAAVPKIIKTVTGNGTTNDKIEGVVGDLAESAMESAGAGPSVPTLTVTLAERARPEAAGALEDVAATALDVAASGLARSASAASTQPTNSITARVAAAVDSAMSVHTKTITDAIAAATADPTIPEKNKSPYAIAIMPATPKELSPLEVSSQPSAAMPESTASGSSVSGARFAS